MWIWTYYGKVVVESTRCVASYVVECCRVFRCDGEHDQRTNDGNKAQVPEPREGPGRGLVAGVYLHIDKFRR